MVTTPLGGGGAGGGNGYDCFSVRRRWMLVMAALNVNVFNARDVCLKWQILCCV